MKSQTFNESRRLALASAAACLGAMVCQTATAASSAVAIASITGSSDGAGVVKGLWTGQPSNAPNRGNYAGYRVIPVANNPTLLISGGNTYDWTINGSGFGATRGSVWLLDGAQNQPATVTSTIISWSDTKIVVRFAATLAFTANGTTKLWVSRLLTKPPPASSVLYSRISAPSMSILNTRGYGQCTWYVANVRAANARRIPSPGAYATNGMTPSVVGAPDNGYVPQQWDALTYAGHVAIITTAPQRVNGADGTVTWTFTLSEMNATWNESANSSTRTYKLSRPGATGRRTVVTPIGSLAGATKTANGYWR
jgi:hypothetical protein